MFEFDELALYAGDEIEITKDIIITQPTLKQIKEFGERKYFNAVQTFTSVGADMKWQLWDMGIDYTEIDDFDLFVQYISQLVSSKKRIYTELISDKGKYANILSSLSQEDIEDMQKNPLGLILKDLDFADFIPLKAKYSEDVEQVVLYHPKKDITINKIIYLQMTEVIRKIHGFKRNNEIPANEQTKMDLIEDARDEFNLAKNKSFKSVILPLLSTLKVQSGQWGNDKIWDSKINEFFYDIKRAGHVQEAKMLLQGAYSGFASLKGVSNDKINMFADL
jgi:hypothetical protein